MQMYVLTVCRQRAVSCTVVRLSHLESGHMRLQTFNLKSPASLRGSGDETSVLHV